MSERRRCWAVRPEGGGPWCFLDRLEDFAGMDPPVDEVFEIKAVLFTDEEIEALPEFDGW